MLFLFDLICGVVFVLNGGVFIGLNLVIMKMLKKDDSVSLLMFYKMLKILKGVSLFVL